MAQHFPGLKPAQQRGLALWVYGTILAQSVCQSVGIGALFTPDTFHAWRQYLREWLYAGKDKAAPCQTEVHVRLCFAPWLNWLLSLCQGEQLALALDATAHGQRLAALVVSVPYPSSAWHILPANKKGAWIPPLLQLLQSLAPVVAPGMGVLVLTDRGLWSPRLWQQIQSWGFHPLMRVKNNTSFQPLGGSRQAARQLLPGPAHAWVGQGRPFRPPTARRFGTLLALWEPEQTEPCLVLTDLPPKKVGMCWYGPRGWIELGFRGLKGVGWHWLILAVASLWVMAFGSCVEGATDRGLAPERLLGPPKQPCCHPRRQVSVLQQGISWRRRQLLRGKLGVRLWLAPEPWPVPSLQL